MPGTTLLAFFAHPDDEAFSCGGTLAAAAARGIDVVVVCATRGEHGPAPDGESPRELAARRSEELERSCDLLGARPPAFLDLPDGGLTDRADELRSRLARQLEAIEPVAVITMGPDGAYGHLDHVACTAALDETAGPFTILHTVFPPGAFERLRRQLGRAGMPLAAVPESAAPADHVVDVRGLERLKLAAIAAHRSQLPGDDPREFLVPGLVELLLTEERFRRAGGPPLGPPLSEVFSAR